MGYREFRPAAALESCVERYWLLEETENGENHIERVIPDGKAEPILHYGDRFTISFGSPAPRDFQLQSRPLPSGQLSRFIYLKATGATGMIGVTLTESRIFAQFLQEF